VGPRIGQLRNHSSDPLVERAVAALAAGDHDKFVEAVALYEREFDVFSLTYHLGVTRLKFAGLEGRCVVYVSALLRSMWSRDKEMVKVLADEAYSDDIRQEALRVLTELGA
jgi:hypothetical protein